MGVEPSGAVSGEAAPATKHFPAYHNTQMFHFDFPFLTLKCALAFHFEHFKHSSVYHNTQMCPCILFHLSVIKGFWDATKHSAAYHNTQMFHFHFILQIFFCIQQFVWTILTCHHTLCISQHSNVPFWVSITFDDSQSDIWFISGGLRCQKTLQTLLCISQHSNASFHFKFW